MARPCSRLAFSTAIAATACLVSQPSPAQATPPPTDEVRATVTAISRIPAPTTELRTWRVTFHLEDRPAAEPIPRELTALFRSPALNILAVGSKYRIGITKHGAEYVVDRSRIWKEWTGKTVPDVRPTFSYYRVMRVLTRRPYLTWFAESSGKANLFISTTGDDPRRPRRGVAIDDAETGILEHLPVTAAEITFDKVPGLGDEFVLVKLSSRAADAPSPLVERMQYLVHRPGGHSRMGDVACQFVGNASIQVTRRDPMTFHVTASASESTTGAASLDYEMMAPEIVPSSASCTIVAPRDDPSASDFEYASTLALADMLSGKGHLRGAGAARQRALHMRPNAENAEDLALLSITELGSGHDGGCSFEPTGPTPLPIPRHLVPLLRAYDDYVTRFPDGRYVPNFMDRKAGYLAQCQHHREAAQLYGTLVDRYPNHPLSEHAGRKRAAELSLAPE